MESRRLFWREKCCLRGGTCGGTAPASCAYEAVSAATALSVCTAGLIVRTPATPSRLPACQHALRRATPQSCRPRPSRQVATARVKGAAKVEIPHIDDHVSKIECVGVQTQKKLEDIRAASAAANVPDLHLPINSVTKGAAAGWGAAQRS